MMNKLIKYRGSVWLVIKTVIETPTFIKQADKIWSEVERLSFIDYIAKNPTAGDVLPNADGARKVRWQLRVLVSEEVFELSISIKMLKGLFIWLQFIKNQIKRI